MEEQLLVRDRVVGERAILDDQAERGQMLEMAETTARSRFPDLLIYQVASLQHEYHVTRLMVSLFARVLGYAIKKGPRLHRTCHVLWPPMSAGRTDRCQYIFSLGTSLAVRSLRVPTKKLVLAERSDATHCSSSSSSARLAMHHCCGRKLQEAIALSEPSLDTWASQEVSSRIIREVDQRNCGLTDGTHWSFEGARTYHVRCGRVRRIRAGIRTPILRVSLQIPLQCNPYCCTPGLCTRVIHIESSFSGCL